MSEMSEDMSPENNFDSKFEVHTPESLTKRPTSQFVPKEKRVVAFESSGGSGKEKPEFKPSWLVDSQDELDILKKGELGETGKEIAMLHLTGIANAQGVEDLAKSAQELGKKAFDEGDNIWPQTVLFISRMTSRVQELSDEATKINRLKPGDVPEGSVGEVKELLRQQQGILDDFKNEKINYDQFLALSQKQAVEARERYARVGPLEERRRWADADFDIEFYQRFSPNVEPAFYAALDPDRRERFDAKWQLARAAYVKKALSSFPEKYKENSDLQLLGKEKLERIWQTPTFKEILRGQARSVKYAEKIPVKLKDGTTVHMSIWDCKDMKTFNSWRKASAMREINSGSETKKEFMKYVQEEASLYGIESTDRVGLSKVAEMIIIENSAAAFDVLSIFGYIESKHTRYGGIEYSAGLPGVVESADFRGVFHPQERYEGKMNSKQNWGQFSLWGITQMHRIDSETGKKQNEINKGDDYYEYHFTGADKGKYWTWKELSIPASNIEKASQAATKGGQVKVIEVQVPECHPTTTCQSFLEAGSVEDKILKGENLDWSNVGEDDVVIWLFSKFNKGVQLVEYFNPGKPLESDKPSWALAWTQPLQEILETRLQLNRSYDEESYKKLKSWIVHAATGGVFNPTHRDASFSRGVDVHTIGRTLSDRKIGHFLNGWKDLLSV